MVTYYFSKVEKLSLKLSSYWYDIYLWDGCFYVYHTPQIRDAFGACAGTVGMTGDQAALSTAAELKVVQL